MTRTFVVRSLARSPLAVTSRWLDTAKLRDRPLDMILLSFILRSTSSSHFRLPVLLILVQVKGDSRRMVHCFEPLFDVQPRGAASRVGSKRKRRTNDSDASSANESTQGEIDGSAEDSSPEQHADFAHAQLGGDAPSKPPRLPSKQRNLKVQHSHVLNAIMHRCLLDHDYARAGKAFALLLRQQVNGRHVDIRKHGLWGIGAEILLRTKGVDTPTYEEGGGDDDDALSDREELEGQGVLFFSPEGFQAARDYYNRLIVQYPFRTNRPNDVSAKDFYPEMISLWIFQIQAQSRMSKKALQSTDLPSSPSSSVSDTSAPTVDEPVSKQAAAMREINNEELRQAREVAASLSDLTISPPYDRNPRILKLQGRVAWWMWDLTKAVMGEDSSQISELKATMKRAFQKALEHGAKLLEHELEMINETES